MHVNTQLSLLAERLFGGESYQTILRSDRVERYARDAEIYVRKCSGVDESLLSGEAWLEVRRSIAKSLAWLLLFRLPENRLHFVMDARVETRCELLRRVVADCRDLESHFQNEARGISALKLDISDRHRGGRTVAAVTFESGLKLIYKPRDIGIEAWFAAFQKQLSEMGAPFPFRPLQVLTRSGYGWTDFVLHRRCREDGELRAFYRNAGALLCLLHVLRATDGHFENLMACGEMPIFIDAETLFQPSLSVAASGISVLRTGMLPRFLPSPAPVDLAALSFVSPQLAPVPVPVAGGDRLEMVELTPETNVPFPEGVAPRPQDYVEEMMEGFRATWGFVAGKHDVVLNALEGARMERVRYVFRDTLTYYQSIIAALYAGDLDALTLPPLPPAAETAFFAVKAAERASLRGMDIPRFSLITSETSLDGAIDCFPRSGFELARRGIEGMSEAEMEKQIAIIQFSWGLFGAAQTGG